jgi:hypothetical protein
VRRNDAGQREQRGQHAEEEAETEHECQVQLFLSRV